MGQEALTFAAEQPRDTVPCRHCGKQTDGLGLTWPGSLIVSCHDCKEKWFQKSWAKFLGEPSVATCWQPSRDERGTCDVCGDQRWGLADVCGMKLCGSCDYLPHRRPTRAVYHRPWWLRALRWLARL